MRGSVEKYETSDGTRWRIRYELPPDADGKRRQRSRRGFVRQKEAQKALTTILGDLDGGTYIAPDRLTLAGYLVDEWLPTIKARTADGGRRHRGTVSAATWDAYRRDVERYVVPRLGTVPLQQLTPAHLDTLYDDLEREGGRGGRPLAAKTVANVAGVVHKALSDAVRRGRLPRNPADAVSPPKASKPHTEVWTVEQLRRFLEHVAGHDQYAAWLLFSTTGMRRGEVAGLTWDDVDLETGRLRVGWTLGHVAHRLTWKPRPKSKAGERTMALDPATVAALREHRRRQLETRLAMGAAWSDTYTDWQGLARSGLVWTYGDGSPIHPKTFTERFLRLAADAGLPRIRLHDVRHTYAGMRSRS
jgi:integrase